MGQNRRLNQEEHGGGIRIRGWEEKGQKKRKEVGPRGRGSSQGEKLGERRGEVLKGFKREWIRRKKVK